MPIENVERIFSAMSLVKLKLRNSMGDDLLDHCPVRFIEEDVFSGVNEKTYLDLLWQCESA